jgi:hypothetical protein
MSTAAVNQILNTPVLYVEESIKTRRSGVTTKYDTDWRIYIIYRYGKYLFCGTRQPFTADDPNPTAPVKKHKNRDARNEKKKHNRKNDESWPVISMSFNYPSEVYSFMTSLFGTSKVNLTLYISPKPIVDMDTLFVHPSHANMKIMDRERQNRKMELVGYDRAYVEPFFFNEQKINLLNLLKQMLSNLDIMGSGPSGMGLSFTCNINTKNDEKNKDGDEQPDESNASASNESNDLNESKQPSNVVMDNYEYNYDSDYTYDAEW